MVLVGADNHCRLQFQRQFDNQNETMSTTIEEAANEYAANAYYPAPDYGWYESDDEQMKEVLSDTFKAGANYVYGLPLASRLTSVQSLQKK